jgi:hypothetical protein
MPKVKLASLAGIKTKGTERVFSVYGRDSAGRDLEIEFPLSILSRLAVETRRAAIVAPRLSSVPADAKPGEYGEVQALDVRSASVGTLMPPAGPAVGVVFDQGQDTELAFRLPAKAAHELGKLLLAEAEKLKDEPVPPQLRT